MRRLGPAPPLLLLAVAACTSDTSIQVLKPEISVAPDALEFEDTPVDYSATEVLYISNAGRDDLDVTLSLTGDDVFSFETASFTVDADDMVELPLTFLPETYLTYAATLLVTSNDEESPEIEVPLVGTGVYAPTPDIDVDPTTLDFGEDVYAPTTDWLTLTNTGDADLTLGTLVQSGSGAFVLASDPSDAVVAPGDSVPIIVVYEPTVDTGDAPVGDNGTLVIPSDDPDEPEVTIYLLGNGGGDFEYPEAVIDCPGTSEPPEWIDLDGAASSDPNGLELTYAWSITSTPTGSQAELTNEVSDHTELYTDIAGDYVVSLQVTNSAGVKSAPDKCEIAAIPADELHVELTWDAAAADLDLHLLTEDATLFQADEDCNWCNQNPEWGDASSNADDPTLDLDDRGGYGPENINIETPADGTYQVKVHYFDDHGDDVVVATVRIYTYGELEAEYSQVMERNEVWDVALVNWPEGTAAEQSNELSEAEYRSCQD